MPLPQEEPGLGGERGSWLCGHFSHLQTWPLPPPGRGREPPQVLGDPPGAGVGAAQSKHVQPWHPTSGQPSLGSLPLGGVLWAL